MNTIYAKSLTVLFFFSCAFSNAIADQNKATNGTGAIPQILSNVSVKDQYRLGIEHQNAIRGETYPIYSYRYVTRYRWITRCVPLCRKVKHTYKQKVRGRQIGTREEKIRDNNGRVIATRNY